MKTTYRVIEYQLGNDLSRGDPFMQVASHYRQIIMQPVCQSDVSWDRLNMGHEIFGITYRNAEISTERKLI